MCIECEEKMKKGIVRLINLLVIIVLFVLAIDLSLNMSLRESLKEHFKRYEIVEPEESIVLLSDHQFFIAEDSTILDKADKTNTIYIPINWLNQFNMTGQYDEANQILNLVSRDYLITATSNETQINLSKSDEVLDWQISQDNIFVNLEQLISWGIIDDQSIEFNKNDKSIVIINKENLMTDNSYSTQFLYSHFDQAVSRQKENRGLGIKDLLVKESIGAKLEKGNAYYWVPINDSIAYTVSGSHYGYMLLNQEQKDSLESLRQASSEPLPTSGVNTDKVNLIWEAIYNVQPKPESIPQMGNMNVVSPTWYELKDQTGALHSKFNQDYLNWAQGRNYKVWALVSNQFDPTLTHQLLVNANYRRTFIENIVTEAVKHNLEGINIDFENINLEDKDNLTHFINELRWYAKQYDLVLSMDVTVMDGSDNWSKCYDRKALGKIVDYLIIMTYDEYWASSPVSGPVSSADWVEKSLKKIMTIVPRDKIVMGIPLYSRLWRERISETLPNTNKTSSSAISMIKQNELIETSGQTPIWDDENKLYYISYIEDDTQVKIWIENAETISYKIDIAKNLDLGGIAFWRRGFETDNFWNEIELLER